MTPTFACVLGIYLYPLLPAFSSQHPKCMPLAHDLLLKRQIVQYCEAAKVMRHSSVPLHSKHAILQLYTPNLLGLLRLPLHLHRNQAAQMVLHQPQTVSVLDFVLLHAGLVHLEITHSAQGTCFTVCTPVNRYALQQAARCIDFLTLNPPVQVLQSLCGSGENEDIRARIAGGLGGFAQFCSLDELRQMMAGPLATNSGQPADRLGKALTIASTAQHAAQRSASKALIHIVWATAVCATPN